MRTVALVLLGLNLLLGLWLATRPDPPAPPSGPLPVPGAPELLRLVDEPPQPSSHTPG